MEEVEENNNKKTRNNRRIETNQKIICHQTIIFIEGRKIKLYFFFSLGRLYQRTILFEIEEISSIFDFHFEVCFGFVSFNVQNVTPIGTFILIKQ